MFVCTSPAICSFSCVRLFFSFFLSLSFFLSFLQLPSPPLLFTPLVPLPLSHILLLLPFLSVPSISLPPLLHPVSPSVAGCGWTTPAHPLVVGAPDTGLNCCPDPGTAAGSGTWAASAGAEDDEGSLGGIPGDKPGCIAPGRGGMPGRFAAGMPGWLTGGIPGEIPGAIP